MMAEISARRRRDVIDALRRGVVPGNGLDVLAVGLDRCPIYLAGALRVGTIGPVALSRSSRLLVQPSE